MYNISTGRKSDIVPILLIPHKAISLLDQIILKEILTGSIKTSPDLICRRGLT